MSCKQGTGVKCYLHMAALCTQYLQLAVNVSDAVYRTKVMPTVSALITPQNLSYFRNLLLPTSPFCHQPSILKLLQRKKSCDPIKFHQN